MDADLFWLSDRQFARIAPHLPTDTRGKPRVDDRRVISGILQILLSGARWTDAPSAWGPRKTLSIGFSAGLRKASGRACSRRWRRAVDRLLNV